MNIRKLCMMLPVVLIFTSCRNTLRPGHSEPSVSTQVQQTDKPDIKSGWTSEVVKIDTNLIEKHVYAGYEYDTVYGASGTYNINGNDHEISIALKNTTNDQQYPYFNVANVSVDGASTNIDICGYSLSYSAAVEHNGNEILLFTGIEEENDWTDLYVFKYDGKEIKNITIADSDIDTSGNGYSVSNTRDVEINLKNDSEFEMWKKTLSTGMWNIKKTYKLEDDIIISHSQEKYETDTKEFLTPFCSYEEWQPYEGLHEVSKEEYSRLYEGYVMCHKNYDMLKEGEYFTMLYDDCKGNIYVKTENGKEGWIALPDYPIREDINHFLLYMAG